MLTALTGSLAPGTNVQNVGQEKPTQSPAATFLTQLGGLRQGPHQTTSLATPSADDAPEQTAQPTLPGGSSEELAELKQQIASALTSLPGATDLTGAKSPAEAVQDVLHKAQVLLDHMDRSTGSNFGELLRAGLTERGMAGQDAVPANNPAQAMQDTLDLVASIISVDLPPARVSPAPSGLKTDEPQMLRVAPLLSRHVSVAAGLQPNLTTDPDVTGDAVAPQKTQQAAPTHSVMPSTALHEAQPLRNTILQQIAEARPNVLRYGETTSLDLSPAGLGRLEIEVETANSGALRIVLRAENPLVLDALRSDRSALAAALTGENSDGALNLESFEGGGGAHSDRSNAPPVLDDPETALRHETPQQLSTTPTTHGALILDIIA